MALQFTRLTEVVQLGAAAAVIYTNPAATKSHVRGFGVHNTNASTENVSIYWVPDAAAAVGTPTLAMRILFLTLAANETVYVDPPYGYVMTDTNETIQAFSTTANKVNITVHGDRDA